MSTRMSTSERYFPWPVTASVDVIPAGSLSGMGVAMLFVTVAVEVAGHPGGPAGAWALAAGAVMTPARPPATRPTVRTTIRPERRRLRCGCVLVDIGGSPETPDAAAPHLRRQPS